MALSPGAVLGPYEIQTPLGAGGMGEVYRARDTRLGRDVAIKVLAAGAASDPSLRQRLEREAKAVSRLSHPHICTLHDVGHHEGLDFLVMELVEGETLEQRLTSGPLPPDQVLRYAGQIADALAEAHKVGITHRDLKPANIMVTKGGTKLMDFGLAKQTAVSSMAGPPAEETATRARLTGEGALVGTFHYMAPEQLEGKEADPRTDIFALGEVIYEMATGAPPFNGTSRANLIAAILTTEPPPITHRQPLVPAALDRVVRRCLAKDPEDRWQSAADLASELTWLVELGSTAQAEASRRAWSRSGWIAAGFLAVLAAAAVLAWLRVSSRRAPAMYFHAAVPFPANDVALSPDGHVLAVVAYSSQLNDFGLWIYEVGSRRVTPIEGTQGASYPFWAPDGKSIAFFADGRLKRAAVAGGQVQVVCRAPNGRGGTWNRDGVIVVSPFALAGLARVPAWGGDPVPIDTLDDARFETSHRWPVFLPDGRHFLYLAANFTGRWDQNAVFVGALDSQEKHFVVATSANAAYAEPGYLVYWQDGNLVAQRFDLRSYTLRGEPRVLTDEISYFPQVDRAVFAVTGEEALIVQPGKGASAAQMTWFDRQGRMTGTVGAPGLFDNVRLSPDGRLVGVDKVDTDGRNVDVWIFEVARDAATRFTFDPGLEQVPIWSSDGKQILYSSNRGSREFHVWRKNADGSGAEDDLIGFGPNALVSAWDWSRDGRYLLFRKNNELWYIPWASRDPKRLLTGEATVRNAQFSPDGRWIAYASDESGAMEVYVSAFPSGPGKWQISTAGGTEPKWRGDGRELFYLSPDGRIMAASVTAGAGFAAGPPVPLFQTHRRPAMSSQDFFSYDVTSDGLHFLVATRLDEGHSAPLSIVLNWASGIEK